jgi:hypothetical protein
LLRRCVVFSAINVRRRDDTLTPAYEKELISCGTG